MDPFAREPAFVLPSLVEAGNVAARLVVAAALAGALGYEREREGKAAGLRTHMLVALGSAPMRPVLRLDREQREHPYGIHPGKSSGPRPNESRQTIDHKSNRVHRRISAVPASAPARDSSGTR